MRATHGKGAVILKGCGRFELAEDLSVIADMTHIDLSGIDTLEGECWRAFPSYNFSFLTSGRLEFFFFSGNEGVSLHVRDPQATPAFCSTSQT